MPDTTPTPPPISFDSLQTAITPTRWAILRELADGGSLLVSELAQRLGVSPDVISKNLGPLRRTGIVINPRIRLMEIAPQFLADKTERVLDLGWALLRMNTGR